jgi:pantetheine-phosphate adenylyltransferase
VTSYELPPLCYIRRRGNCRGDYLYYWTVVFALFYLERQVLTRHCGGCASEASRQTSIAIDFARRIESSVTRAARGRLKKVIAMYPGSFDPPTNGHLDLIARGSKIFDELVVAVLRNAEKAPLFNLPERLHMLEAMTADFKNVRVETFDGLMVDYAAKVKASAVLRGIRAISDYEYELQMALMNRKLQPDLETVFMMPAEQYSYLSSRLVREIAQLGGSVKDLVPELVEQRLKEKLDPAIKLANARKLKPRKRG